MSPHQSLASHWSLQSPPVSGVSLVTTIPTSLWYLSGLMSPHKSLVSLWSLQSPPVSGVCLVSTVPISFRCHSGPHQSLVSLWSHESPPGLGVCSHRSPHWSLVYIVRRPTNMLMRRSAIAACSQLSACVHVRSCGDSLTRLKPDIPEAHTCRTWSDRPRKRKDQRKPPSLKNAR